MLAVVVLVCLVAGGVQAVRSASLERAAAAERADRADRAASIAEARADAAEAKDRLLAEQDAAAVARSTLWSARTEGAAAQLTAADAVLAESEGKVTDDAVRTALADGVAAARALLEASAGTVPGDLRAADAALTSVLAHVAEASAGVAAARTAWQAAQDAAAAERAAQARAATAPPSTRTPSSAPRLGGPPSVGAGPDCGGPGSYEPPKNDGSPSFYTSTPTAEGDGSNGKVPASAMSRLGWCTDSQGNGQWLRTAAATALTRLNEAFRAQFGENIAVDLSYRSYADQVAMREYYGTVAAVPGTSNHGLGLAFDVWEWSAYSFGSARYDWLVANGPDYGWVAPGWARASGSNPEYWHYEYVG